MAPRDLSFVINHGFAKNFFDFIGDYRIHHVMTLLDQTQESRPLLEVIVESGFNSKYVFNTAFKQKIGMTPTQYRNRGYLTGVSLQPQLLLTTSMTGFQNT